MLITTQIYNWSGNFAFKPPLEPAILNTDQIVSMREDTCDRCGRVVIIKMTDGSTHHCDSTIKDISQQIALNIEDARSRS